MPWINPRRESLTPVNSTPGGSRFATDRNRSVVYPEGAFPPPLRRQAGAFTPPRAAPRESSHPVAAAAGALTIGLTSGPQPARTSIGAASSRRMIRRSSHTGIQS